MTDLRALLDNAPPRPWFADGGRIHEAPDERTSKGFTVVTMSAEGAAALIVALVNSADEREAVVEAARAFILDGDVAGVAHVGALRAALAALDAKTGAA